MRTEGSSLCHANVEICEESAEIGASIDEELACWHVPADLPPFKSRLGLMLGWVQDFLVPTSVHHPLFYSPSNLLER